jgi:dolichol-phosphate mannosyltransferase
MIRLAWTAVTGFSYFPLQIMVYVSATLGILSVLTIPVIAILRITQGPEFFGGQATNIVLMLMLSSFQLFFLFIMGQYVARIYDETRGRPLYVVASTANINADEMPSNDNLSGTRPYITASTIGFDDEELKETETASKIQN